MNRRKPFWRGLPGQNYRRRVTFVLYTALPLLIWRLLDLLEEIINGPIKMGLDRYVITGTPATALQVLIIAVLFFVTFGAANVSASPAKEEPLD